MAEPKHNLERKIELLEICFDTFCKYGLENTVELSIFVQSLNPQNYAASVNGCSKRLL